MRKWFVATALLGGMAYLGSTTAQEFDQELFKKMRQAGQIMRDHPVVVANNPGVQKELKLDEDQVKAVKEKVTPPAGTFGFGGGGGFGKGKGKGGGGGDFKERFAKQMERMQVLKDVPDDKMEEKVHEIYKEELDGPTKELDKILKPEQQARLKQIARQQGGPRAYLKTQNVKDLNLTDEQKTKLREIVNEHDKDVAELMPKGGFGKGGGGFSPETREKMEALNKEAAEKAGNVLTADQKSKWKELIGEPYTIQFGRPKKDD
ncbi:MAG TPA: hypothetical protein VKD90_16990 [Gemmataceae bacterium]|nr:hypothetical protein [Gemmataceae bacterium]